MNFSAQIKAKASEIGFAKAGIVAADALNTEASHLGEWLGLAYHGNMAWMEREPEKRADPRILFPGAKSIIVVAHNYYTNHKHTDDQGLGKISRYAWGDDYHDVLRDKLKELLAWIQKENPPA